MTDKKTADAADRTRALRHLRELIAALDRRVPHIERLGEIAIAGDAANAERKGVGSNYRARGGPWTPMALTCSQPREPQRGRIGGVESDVERQGSGSKHAFGHQVPRTGSPAGGLSK